MLKCCCLFQAPNLESRELWKGFLYSVIDVNMNHLYTCTLCACLFSCLTCLITLFSLQLNVPSCLTLLPGQLQMLKEVVDKERSRRRSRNPSRAPPSPLSVPLVGEIPPWVQLWRCTAAAWPHDPYCCVFDLQVFSPGVSNRGWSPFRKTPRLWQHAASSRQRRMLTGCHHPTGPQWVNTRWICGQQVQKSWMLHTLTMFLSLLQFSVQTLQSHSEGPRWLCHWCGEPCKCIFIVIVVIAVLMRGRDSDQPKTQARTCHLGHQTSSDRLSALLASI